MTQPPRLPDRTPVSKRESRWPIFLSVFIGLMAMVLVVFLILAILAYLDFRQILLTLNKAPESPTPVIVSTAEPTVAPMPVFQFLMPGKFNFDEPIEVAFTYSYLDPQQIEFQLLGVGKTNLPDEVSDKVKLEGDKVTIPAQLLVGQFTLRAHSGDKVLADFPIEIRPPQLELSDLIEVQPPLELNNKYILLPDESKIALKEKYRNKGWSLSTQRFEFRGGSAEITFVGPELSTSSLDLAIEITGAYDSQGGRYQHPVRLPLVKLSSLQNPSGGLSAYDISNACAQSVAPPSANKALEDISTFAGEIFSISEICEGGEVSVPGGYMLVMVIGDINRGTPGISTSPGLQTFPALPDSGQSQGGQKAQKPELLKVGDGSKKQSMEPKDVRYFFVREVEAGDPAKPEDDLFRIVLFGLIAQQ